MTPSNRTPIALAIAPNALYVAGLAGLMGSRTIAGLQPLPDGALPYVMGLTGFISIMSVAAASVIRLRRDALKARARRSDAAR